MSGGIADDIAATMERATMDNAKSDLEEAGIVFSEFNGFMADEPPEFDWIIKDIIANRFKGDLNGKSKTWKSFFLMQLAMCVSCGRPFLGMDVPKARRTVLFNLELIERGAWERFDVMRRGAYLTPASDMLWVVNLRGGGDRLRDHIPALVAEIRRRGVELCLVDPRYKLLHAEEDENSASGLRGVLDFRDALAEQCATIFGQHDPKGSVEGKSMADRGAGSYTAGADYDFSFALSPHEIDGRTVLSTSCRYRKSPDDLTIRFDPERLMFEAEPDTPATVKQTRRGGGGSSTDPKAEAERERLKLEEFEKAVVEFAEKSELMDMKSFRLQIATLPAAKAGGGIGWRRDALDALIEKRVIAKTPEKVRTEGGGTKCKKNGSTFVGSPAKVAAYNRRFEEFPL